jgi:hypothetical protein
MDGIDYLKQLEEDEPFIFQQAKIEQIGISGKFMACSTVSV